MFNDLMIMQPSDFLIKYGVSITLFILVCVGLTALFFTRMTILLVRRVKSNVEFERMFGGSEL